MKISSKASNIATDETLGWVDLRCPQLVEWRSLAIRWLAQFPKNKREKCIALNFFIERYVHARNLPESAAVFLQANAVWPNFYDHLCNLVVREKARVAHHDQISDFLRFVLLSDFSDTDEYGDREILPGYRQPVIRIQKFADRGISDTELRAHNDKKLRWITKLYPELAAWRRLAVEWMAGQTGTTKPRLLAIQCFIREIIVEHGLPLEPRAIFESSTYVPDFYAQTIERRNISLTKPYTTHLHTFMEWVLEEKFSEIGEDGKKRVCAGLRNPIVSYTKKADGRGSDKQLTWVVLARPELETWRHYAASWLATEKKGIDIRLKALVAFFDRFLIGMNLPSEPAALLKRGSLVPDFYATCCASSKDGKIKEPTAAINNNNRLSDFLDWVLNRHFSIEDEDGVLMVAPAFRNFIPYRSSSGGRENRETVHSPLPFAFIEDMRLMLCQGPTFGDWSWAQQALGGEINSSEGGDGSDWYAVNKEDIDQNDPDCVWRVRKYEAGHVHLQMWSPVRWVGLLVKLQIPLRMMQVRLLDSGEADTWRYAGGVWIENKHPLATGTDRSPLAQGVFRRTSHLKGVTAPAILYVNTNKTACEFPALRRHRFPA